MSDERNAQLTAAYTRPARLKIGHLEARPISIGTVNAAKQLGITLLDGVQPPEGDTTEMLRQLTALLWLQTTDPDEVFQALEDGTAEGRIKRFAFDVPLEMLEEFKASVGKDSAHAQAAAVQVRAKPGGTEKDTPPNS